MTEEKAEKIYTELIVGKTDTSNDIQTKRLMFLACHASEPCAACGCSDPDRDFAMLGIDAGKTLTGKTIKICRNCDDDSISTYGR